MKTKLLSCPFCDGTPEIKHVTHVVKWSVNQPLYQWSNWYKSRSNAEKDEIEEFMKTHNKNSITYYYIYCKECGVAQSREKYYRRDLAEAAWNMRP